MSKFLTNLIVATAVFIAGGWVGVNWAPIKTKIKKVISVKDIKQVSEPKSYTYDWENDPIGEAFFGKTKPMLKNIMEQYEESLEYKIDDFPLPHNEHIEFRKKIIDNMISSMTGRGGDGSRWLVRGPYDKNYVPDLYDKEFVSSVSIRNLKVDLYNIFIKDTGDTIPVAICIPKKTPAPAVIAFSGHTHFGLRELFVDLDSYQRAIAWRLCEAGFVAAAVEKIDSGISSILFQKKGEHWRGDIWADDEDRISTILLGMGDYLIPARQLMANIATVEMVAAMDVVGNSQIGAVGISLGGWLTLHTALFNERIKAVANFGGMWSYLDHYKRDIVNPELVGINDFSQLFPGIWRYGDQFRFIYAAAPIPMLTGYGKKDYPYVNFKEYFHPRITSQYEALGRPKDIEVVVHEGGHVLPENEVIDFFKRRLHEK